MFTVHANAVSRRLETNTYKGYYYIHAYPEEAGNEKLVCVSSMYSCREYFVTSYRREINEGDGFIPCARGAYALISCGRPPLPSFEAWKTQLYRNSEKGLYIINSFEKAHKWPLTKLYPVRRRSTPCLFFSGPRRWTMSPYLMSIWAMGIRLGRNNWLPKNLLTLNHKGVVDALVESARKRNSSEDALQLESSIREWDPFMTLYPDLFGDNTRKYHWDVAHLHGDSGMCEGIRVLMNGNTKYKKLHKKYFKLKEAKKLK